MAYIVGIPNGAQSPGLFPAQANENFQRLLDIINNDHVFNLAQNVGTDGIHKKSSYVNQASSPAIPAGVNSILYPKLDANSQSQLYFKNGVDDIALTPPALRVAGTASLAGLGSTTIFPDPGYQYTAIGWAMDVDGRMKFYSVFHITATNRVDLITESGLTNPPTFLFSTDDLQIRNTLGVPKTVLWSLIVNRIP